MLTFLLACLMCGAGFLALVFAQAWREDYKKRRNDRKLAISQDSEAERIHRLTARTIANMQKLADGFRDKS